MVLLNIRNDMKIQDFELKNDKSNNDERGKKSLNFQHERSQDELQFISKLILKEKISNCRLNQSSSHTVRVFSNMADC